MSYTRVRPTHRCNVCGAYWRQWRDSWSLTSKECGRCCDMTDMPAVLPLVDYDEHDKEVVNPENCVHPPRFHEFKNEYFAGSYLDKAETVHITKCSLCGKIIKRETETHSWFG